MWLGHPSLRDLINSNWSLALPHGNKTLRVILKLRRLKEVLKGWNISDFGNNRVRKHEAYNKVETIQCRISTEGNSLDLRLQEVLAKMEYTSILDRESSFYRQKNRGSWLRDGDRNTAFFHRSSKQRKVSSRINFLEVDGQITNDRGVFSSRIIQYFRDIFSFAPVTSDRDFLQDIMSSEVTAEQNDMLISIPARDEVKAAVFALSPESAPGPDGFGGYFFQRFWEVIGEDMYEAVAEYFRTGVIPTGMNSSFVTLIPKGTDVTRVEDYRPIVLGNFLYKVVTKILANRLGVILAKVISPNQFGFIPGRNIHDCIALASEGVNSLDNPAGKLNMAIKVDI